MNESTSTQQQKQYKIFLTGESCTDEYRYGICNRLSPEAPVPVFDLEHTTIRNGMAANVKNNLEAFGMQVEIHSNWPAMIRRTRFIDSRSGQQLLREDEDTLADLYHDSDFHDEALNRFPSASYYDAVVISDYDKGFLTTKYIRALVESFNGPIFVDSKRCDLSFFEGCYIKVNAKEHDLIEKMPKECTMVVTSGASGASVDNVHYPAPKTDVFDITGAGDVFLATLTYFMLEYGNLDRSIHNAVALASVSVTHHGTYVLSREDIDEICD